MKQPAYAMRIPAPAPIKSLWLCGSDDGLCGVYFNDPGVKTKSSDFFADTIAQLSAYFNGELRSFDLPLNLAGTPFQSRVWKCLRDIGYGQTKQYGEIAKKAKSPKAARAVGAACGSNPISIVIPCHRVVGSNGALTGFGGGIKAKRYLLNLENEHL